MRRTTLVALACILLGSSCIRNRGKYYPDDHGGQIYFPLGDSSFADLVFYIRTGDPEPDSVFGDHWQAVGIPDYDGEEYGTGFVSLGGSGQVGIQFTDNVLVDVPGPDLCVLEIGDPEPFEVSISRDQQTWISLGVQTDPVCLIDIQGKARPGAEYRFVRITDLRSRLDDRAPGADIDAIGAFGR
jgi:OOP family OmpA-OmpF porin